MRRSQNFDFMGLKYLSPGQFLVSSNPRKYHGILKLLVATWKSVVWEQNCVWFFYYFNFQRNYDVLKSKSPYILLNKNYQILIKTKGNWKWKIPHTVLERQTLCFSSIKNQTVMNWSLRKTTESIFCTAYFVWRDFFLKICVISHV